MRLSWRWGAGSPMENNRNAEWWCGSVGSPAAWWSTPWRPFIRRPSPTCDGQLIMEGVTCADQDVEIVSDQWRIVFIGPTRSFRAPPTCIFRTKRGEKKNDEHGVNHGRWSFFFFFSILSHKFRIYNRAVAIWRLVTSQKWGCGFSPYGTIKVILTFFFLFSCSMALTRGISRDFSLSKERHLWAPSPSTSIEITCLFFPFFFWRGTLSGALAQIKPRLWNFQQEKQRSPRGYTHATEIPLC